MTSLHRFFTGLIIFSCQACFSQEVPKGFEVSEFAQVAEAYRSAPNMSFNMLITYTDSAYPTVIEEQIQGNYKLKGGNYWAMLDSIEFVQGTQYNVSIFLLDSMMAVNKPQPYPTVLQLPMLDSIFRQSNVSSLQVTRLNDSTRSMFITFNQQSSYRSYQMLYDLNSFVIRQVKYYIPNSNGAPGSSGVDCVTITFSNYSDQVISDDIFDESKFIYKQGNQLFPQPAFSGFNVVVGQNTIQSN